jgi:hypothetical protein
MQLRPIANNDHAPLVIDDSAATQRRCRLAHGRARTADHSRDKIMRELESIGFRSAGGQEQPA